MSTKYLPPSIIKLEHWQNVETNRTGYLRGLALDCYEHPDNDRNSHYLARDLFWSGRHRSAIKEFNRHIYMNRWPAERAQSMIFVGDSEIALGNEEAGLQCYHRAFLTDSGRREALIRLADFMMGKKDWQRAIAYAEAALTIPWNSFYANRMEHYREVPHWILYQAYCWLGRMEEGKRHWQMALAFQPLNSTSLHDARFYLDLPKVSIVIPTLGREEQLKKLVALLEDKQYVNYPDYEVVIELDSFENRQGVAKTLKAGVARANGELICFLGNDCIPQKDFLILAVLKGLERFSSAPGVGLVALNDGLWNGTLATHWLASKTLAECLGGEFFHTGYEHVGCDNELTARCKKLHAYVYCEEAKISHPTPGSTDDAVSRLAWDPDAVQRDRELLKRRSHELGFELV